MKIAVSARVDPPTTREFEVELPLYRVQDCGGDDYSSMHYTKITVGEVTHCSGVPSMHVILRAVTLVVRHSYNKQGFTYELEIDVNYHFDKRSDADYNLGRGEHALTKEEWDAVAAKMKQALEHACT